MFTWFWRSGTAFRLADIQMDSRRLEKLDHLIEPCVQVNYMVMIYFTFLNIIEISYPNSKYLAIQLQNQSKITLNCS